jgi:hypothetical protein
MSKAHREVFDSTDSFAGACAFRDDKLPYSCLIYTKERKMSVLAHEAIHASNYILEAIGHMPSQINDEVHAYIVQYICEEVEKKV